MSLGELFPGLEYIGPSPHDCLRLQLPQDASEVRISLGCAHPEILNLSSLRLFDVDGRRLSLHTDDFGINISSTFNDDPQFGVESVVRGGGCHTKLELNPALAVSWKTARPALIEILNRGDRFGRRTASINISAKTPSGWQPLYQHSSAARALYLFTCAAEYMSSSDIAIACAVRALPELRSRVVEGVERRAQAGLLNFDSARWLLALMDIYGTPGDDDIRLLCIYFSQILLRDGIIRNLSPAWKILDTPQKIIRAEELINSCMESAGAKGGYIFTRHGIVRSKLLSDRREYIVLAESVVQTLAAQGVQCFVSYGTLLGAIRERAFIAHDDDLDLVYLTEGEVANPTVRDRVIDILRQAGFVVAKKDPLLNLDVSRPGSDVTVDLFPSWRTEGSIFLYMERMAIRAINEALVTPLAHVNLYEAQFPCPANPQGFLEERYGDSWGRSDRFFEWPYALSKGGQ